MTPASDTITTADGRTISLSELRKQSVETANFAVENSFSALAELPNTVIALVDEIRRLRERVAELAEAAKIGLARIQSDVESYSHNSDDGNFIRSVLAKGTP